MAEEKKQETLSDAEAQALEQLLSEGGAPAGEEAPAEPQRPGLLKNKFLMIGLALGLLVVAGGVTAYLWLRGGETSVEKSAPVTEDKIPPQEEAKKETKENQPYIYTLDPFFLPLLEKDGKETGKFVHIRINFLLGNSKLSQEVDLELAHMRQDIYEILKSKKLHDFNNPKKSIEEQLKSEIITHANSLLQTGSGKIDDVFFTEFVLR